MLYFIFKFVGNISSGNIHSTYLIKDTSCMDHPPIILQQINQEVFPNPEILISNYYQIHTHLVSKINLNENSTAFKHYRFPSLLKVQHQDEYYLTSNRQFWRAFEYLDNTISYPIINDIFKARELGKAIAAPILL